MTRATEAEAGATVDIKPEPVTDAERDFLMPIVRYLEALLEWSRARDTTATTVRPVSGGQPDEPQPSSKPRRKRRSRRL